MALIWMRDFSVGLDARRMPVVSGQAVLTRAHDVHVTPGGDVEQRADFVQVYAGHPAIIGYVTSLGKVWCVVRDRSEVPGLDWTGDRPTGLPARFPVVSIKSLQSGAAPLRIISFTKKGGRGYFVVEFSGGGSRMFGVPNAQGPADRPLYAGLPTTADPPPRVQYVVQGSSVVTVAHARATLIGQGFTEQQANANIAARPKWLRVVDQYAPMGKVLNAHSDSQRDGSGAVMRYEKIGDDYVLAPGIDGQYAYVFVYSGYVDYDLSSITGTTDIEAENRAMEAQRSPLAIHAIARKLILSSGQTTLFSGLANPLAFYPDTDDSENPGAGFVDMTSEIEGRGDITGYATYGDRLAVFFDNETQIWNIDVDISNSKIGQTIPGGTKQPMSVISTAQDVFYADLTGIRSLRARDSSGTLIVEDAGSPVNDIVRGRPVIAAKDPESGRLLFCSGDEIFVLSIYPGSKSAAWTTYGAPVTVAGVAEGWGRLHVYGAGGEIFAYGSPTNSTPYRYSGGVGEVHLPWLNADDPASLKKSTGIDVAADGSWSVSVSTTPTDPEAEDALAEVDGPTFDLGRIPMSGAWTHMQLRFRGVSPVSPTVPARLASVIVHFTGARDAD